jgi:hypothetical protein
MNPSWLESIQRRLAGTPSRRGVLAALTAVAAGAARPAAAACLDNGARCKRGAQCCSGRCAGKKGKKRCKAAPVQGICTIADNACFGDQIPDVVCGVGAGQCFCFVTASGQSFCGDPGAGPGPGQDRSCRKDADCGPAFGRGARCIQPLPACGAEPQCMAACPAIIEPIP